MKSSEDSKVQKSSDEGSLDFGPLLEELQLTAFLSLKELGPTKIRLKKKKKKQNISLDSQVLYVVYTQYSKNRSHLNSHCRTIDFFF